MSDKKKTLALHDESKRDSDLSDKPPKRGTQESMDDPTQQGQTKLDKKNMKKIIAFRGMLAKVFHDLPVEDIKSLAFVYNENRSISKGIDLADKLVKSDCICDCIDDLNTLGEHLDTIKRKDLKNIVDEYIYRNKLPQDSPEHSLRSIPAPYPIPVSIARVSSTQDIRTDESYVIDRPAAINGIGKKRRRVETDEEKDLEEAAGIDSMMLECEYDDTSDSSDEAEGSMDEITDQDKRFMRLAQNAAKNSKDEETKVGAVLVDSTGNLLGTGWNRMPEGCEERLPWERERKRDPIEDSKHLYVVYAIRAAIFDAYKKKFDLTDSILYTTLFPSNVCAQCIREAGISQVVYTSNKFYRTKFMKASRRILKGIKCRQYNDKDCSTN